MKNLITAAALVLLCAGSASAKDLETYKNTYEKEMGAIVLSHGMRMDGLNKQYSTSLDGVLAKVKKAGDLDMTMSVMQEIERFRAIKSMPEAKSEILEIQKLQAIYADLVSAHEVSRAKKVLSLSSKYDRALESLQKRLVSSSALDDAKAVKAERTRVKNSDVHVAASSVLQTGKTARKRPVSAVRTMKTNPKGITIGTIKASVEPVLSAGHKLQVWRVLPEYVHPGEYTIMCQHAVEGKRGAFYLTAWVDTNGDNVPDREISRSQELSGTKQGGWSSWSFSLQKEAALYVGNAWSDNETLIYYKMKAPAPDGYLGLSNEVMVSGECVGPPVSAVKPRYTNIKLTTPVKQSM